MRAAQLGWVASGRCAHSVIACLCLRSLKPVLPLIDWSLVRADYSLSYTFGRLRGLVFSQLKNNVRCDLSSLHHPRADPLFGYSGCLVCCLCAQLWKQALMKTGRAANFHQVGSRDAFLLLLCVPWGLTVRSADPALQQHGVMLDNFRAQRARDQADGQPLPIPLLWNMLDCSAPVRLPTVFVQTWTCWMSLTTACSASCSPVSRFVLEHHGVD